MPSSIRGKDPVPGLVLWFLWWPEPILAAPRGQRKRINLPVAWRIHLITIANQVPGLFCSRLAWGQ
jgi:hypothetical protein